MAAHRAVDKIDFTPGPCRKTLLRYPLSSLPRVLSLSLSSRTSPLIQRNSRHLSTPLYHCFTWEEMRIRGMGERVDREIRNVLFYFLPTSSLSSLLLYRTLIHPSSIEFDNGWVKGGGDPSISNFIGRCI